MNLNFRDILTTVLDAASKALTFQVGEAGANAVVDSGDAVYYGPPGYVARPSDASPDGRSCQCVTINGTDREYILGMRDLRGQEILGNLTPGSGCVYAAGPHGIGQGRMFVKDDGTLSSCSMLTFKDNDPAGLPVAIGLASDGTINLTNGLGFISIGDDGAVSIGHKDGKNYIKFYADGNIDLVGKQIRIFGQQTMLGNGASPATAALTSQSPSPPLGIAPGSPIAGVFPSKSVFIAL